MLHRQEKLVRELRAKVFDQAADLMEKGPAIDLAIRVDTQELCALREVTFFGRPGPTSP